MIECATIADKCAKVGAVGINCTPPRFIHGLILSIRKVWHHLMPSITKLVPPKHTKCISMICILVSLAHCTDHCVEQAAVLFI